jgi:tRNA A-37 threonylcarbamoyl transferase component Bud32
MPDAVPNDRRNFGQYDVESILGRGAMGLVYLARDRRIGRKVALKTVQLDQKFEDESEADEFYKRLQREAEVVGSMQHPNIVTLYEPGYENNVISYLATEYVDGESLKDRLKRSKPLPLDEALRTGEDILRGLAYAHSKGIIHRDIKPANILLSSDGQAKLADFGISRPVDSDLTAVGSMLGTPNYMSPEQVKCAPVTTKSDLFAVGIVMYEMLTGVKPFHGPDVSTILRNVVERDPPLASASNHSVPDVIGNFVARLFRKAPEQRFESAAVALAELQKLRASPLPAAVPEAMSPEMEIATLSNATTENTEDTTSGAATRRQRVPSGLFWAVIAGFLIPLTLWAAAIRMQTDARPAGFIAPTQRQEFATKKHLLKNARALATAGRYDESLKAYDDYITRYPASPAAADERSDVTKRLEAAKAKASITAKAPKPRPVVAKAEEPKEEKKLNWFQRTFGRGRKQQEPKKQEPKKP